MWANPGLFLFTFVLFKHNIIGKSVDFSRIRTRIVGVEGEHADNLTTTATLDRIVIIWHELHLYNKYRFVTESYQESQLDW